MQQGSPSSQFLSAWRVPSSSAELKSAAKKITDPKYCHPANELRCCRDMPRALADKLTRHYSRLCPRPCRYLMRS